MQINLKCIASSLATILLLIVAACAVYGPSLNAPFTFDDEASIVENKSIKQLWPLIDDAQHPGPLNLRTQNPTAGRPLVNLSFALNYEFENLSPLGYRAFNLILHILSTLLMFAIVRRLLRLDFFARRFDDASSPLAFMAALLWMVHPLQTDSVMYVTQRTELSVGFFYLATLYCSLRYWDSATIGNLVRWLLLATLSCFAGMACKEVMVTAPVVVLLFERTFIASTFRRAWIRSWPLYLGLFASWGLLVALNWNGPRSNSAGFHLELSAYIWWFTQVKVLWMYLKLACWPWPLRIHYHLPYLNTFSAAWPWLMASLVLVTVTSILLWRRWSLGYAFAWIILILSPTLIVPILTEVAAERRMYLPLAAFVTLFVAGGFTVLQKMQSLGAVSTGRSADSRWPTTTICVISCLLAIGGSVVAARRAAVYQHEVGLWAESVAQDPEDVVAQYNMGHAPVKTASKERIKESINYFQNAVQLEPKYTEAYNNLGNALMETGQLLEAIANYRQAVELQPDFATAQYNLAAALAEAGDWNEAIGHYQQAIRLLPDWADAHYNLGRALAKSGRRSEAIVQFQQTLDAKSDYADGACATLD